MSGKTHAMVGANAVWVLYLLNGVDRAAPLLLIVGAIGAILPDIDAFRATIHFQAGGILGFLKGIFRHRGFFHSISVLALVIMFGTIIGFSWNPWIPIMLVLGYASHLFIDSFNRGMQFLWPYKKEVSFVPKKMWTKVGGFTDQLFFIVSSFGLAIFLVSNIRHFQI